MDTYTPGAPAPQQALTPVPFRFNTNEVRTIDRDGQVWFVASDIAKALGYADAKQMARWLDEDEVGLHNVQTLSASADGHGGGEQQLLIISESGFYHALLKSRKPEAKPFRRWVTQEVLPAIRRSGEYTPPQNSPLNIVPAGTKLLLTFDAGGRYRAEAVPEGAMVVTAQQIAEILEARTSSCEHPRNFDFCARNRGRPDRVYSAALSPLAPIRRAEKAESTCPPTRD